MKTLLTMLAATLFAAGCTQTAIGTGEAIEAETFEAHPAFDPHMCGGHWHVDRASFADIGEIDALPELDLTVASWERFSGRPGSLSFDEIPAATCTIRATLERYTPGVGYTGHYDDKTGNIVLIVDRMPPCADAPEYAHRCTGPLMLHEIGHGMGVGHIGKDETGIMHESVMASWYSAADHRVCMAAGACTNPSWEPRSPTSF